MSRRDRAERKREREDDANATSDVEADDTYRRLVRESNRRHDERQAQQGNEPEG